MTTITVAVLTLNRPLALEATLRSLKGQISRINSANRLEIWVFENGQDPRNRSVVTKFPDVNLVSHGKNLGLAGNLFEAIKHSKTEWTWVVADDDVLNCDWIAAFRTSKADHLILKRQNRDGDVVDEDLLQRNIGLANNVFRTRPCAAAIASLSSRGLRNDTYPQVLLAQVLNNSEPLDFVAYRDSQVEKNYMVEDFIKVTIRDILRLDASARQLDPKASVLALTSRLASSHLLNYGFQFLNSSTSRSKKRLFLRTVASEWFGTSLRTTITAMAIAFAVQISLLMPRGSHFGASVFVKITRLDQLRSQLKNGCQYSHGMPGYFGYDPKEDR